jgi:CRISPR-associated protein Cas5h
MTELDLEGRDCVSLTVSGDWAHFRRIDTTNDKQTYSVIPRTTVAGLLAAILGEPRDSYYDEFSRASSAIGIVPDSPIRTMQVPMLTVPTTSGDIQTAAGTTGKTVVAPDVLEEKRQRRTFEYIRSPRYRLHVVLDNESWTERLADRLDARRAGPDADDGERDVRAVYTPSLGKTECLARISRTTITELGESREVDAVDSIVPESSLSPATSVQYAMERTPGYMQRDESGRRTTGFISYAFAPDGESLELGALDAYDVANDRVLFT